MATTPRLPISIRVEPAGRGPAVRIIVPTRVVPRATARNRNRRRIREALRVMGISAPAGSRLTYTVHEAELPPHEHLKELLVLITKKSGIVHR